MKPDTEAAAVIPSSQKKPHLSFLLATWFGLGYLPKAPGTWGSAGGALLAIAMQWLFFTKAAASLRMERTVNFWTTSQLPGYGAVIAAALIAVAGVIAADHAARYAKIKDPQWVVIDEVSGQLITYYLFFWVLPLNWKSWLLGFILFRLFDIWKPFPARQFERLPGGWGIMADDWMAGIYAAIVLRVALHFKVI
jgi:phosphatidylglycerophosphatase A